MTDKPRKTRKKYLGDIDYEGPGSLDRRSDDIIDRKPNHDHVVKAWFKAASPLLTLTPEAIDNISTLVAGGNTIPVACAAAGHGSAYVNWNVKAKLHIEAGYAPGFEEGQSPYVAWADAIKQAKASWEVSMVALIASGNPNYKGPLALLERRLPQYYQERKSVQVAVKSERDVAAGLSTEELRKLVAETYEKKLEESND